MLASSPFQTLGFALADAHFIGSGKGSHEQRKLMSTPQDSPTLLFTWMRGTTLEPATLTLCGVRTPAQRLVDPRRAVRSRGLGGRGRRRLSTAHTTLQLSILCPSRACNLLGTGSGSQLLHIRAGTVSLEGLTFKNFSGTDAVGTVVIMSASVSLRTLAVLQSLCRETRP